MNNPTTLKDIFVNPEEKRLRAGWRLLINTILFLFLTIIFAIPAGLVMFFKPEWFSAAMILATGIPIVLAVLVSRKLIDQRSIRSLGLALNLRAGIDVLVGIAIAVMQLTFVLVLEFALGWVELAGFGWQQNGMLPTLGGVLLWLVLFAAVGFYEELLSRGYQLQNLEEGLNTFWAVVLSAAFFGLLHIANPGASWVSTVGIMLAGIFFGFGYLRTRTLWLVVGLHFGWNFVLGPVFGFPVSGMETATLLVLRVTGPAIWTGGEFGPEAGLVVLPALGLGALLIWLYTRKRLVNEESIEINKE